MQRNERHPALNPALTLGVSGSQQGTAVSKHWPTTVYRFPGPAPLEAPLPDRPTLRDKGGVIRRRLFVELRKLRYGDLWRSSSEKFSRKVT